MFPYVSDFFSHLDSRPLLLLLPFFKTIPFTAAPSVITRSDPSFSLLDWNLENIYVLPSSGKGDSSL